MITFDSLFHYLFVKKYINCKKNGANTRKNTHILIIIDISYIT